MKDVKELITNKIDSGLISEDKLISLFSNI